MPRLVIIDHFDSFTFNIVQGIAIHDIDVVVIEADQNLNAIAEARPDGILLSPGPGHPDDAKLAFSVLQEFSGQLPIWGICLGMQIIARYLGMPVLRASEPMHGRHSTVTHDGRGLFSDVSSPQNVVRYHSLVVDVANVPSGWHISAKTLDGVAMGLRRDDAIIEAVQFHPDAVLTACGPAIFANMARRLFTTSPTPMERVRP